MATHKFRIGQHVAISAEPGHRKLTATVTRLMPATREDLDPQYRVKASAETHERMVAESLLDADD